MSENEDARKRHQSLDLLGLRAQATSVGLVQLSIELLRAGVIDDAAVARIKNAIFDDLTLSRPNSVDHDEFDATIRRRLDALFAGSEPVGPPPAAARS